MKASFPVPAILKLLQCICAGISICIASVGYSAPSKSLETKIGSRVNFDADSGETTSTRYFIRQESSAVLYKKSLGLALHTNLYFAVDTDREFIENNEWYVIRPDSLFIEFQRDFFRATAGMQQISWGESFGLPIVDVVNPVDLSEPIGSESQDYKIAVPVTGVEFIGGNFYLQGLYVPLARRSPIPEELNGIEVVKLPSFKVGEASEYGGRVGYLFPFGLDLKAFYYHHNSRLPRFELDLSSSTQPRLIVAETTQNSYGFSISQPLDDVVIRADALFESGYLTPAITRTTPAAEAPFRKTAIADRVQVVGGADYTTSGGNMFGLQFQFENVQRRRADVSAAANNVPIGSEIIEETDVPKYWAGARMMLVSDSQNFSFDIFGFHGVGNDDWWIRPLAKAQFAERFEFTAEANLTDGNGNGNPDIFFRRRNITGTLSYRF
jgi:hypothetical protein